MSLARFAKRRDSAEPAIIRALNAIGWETFQLDRPGDLLCWKAGVWKLLEVKTGRGKKLTVQNDKRQSKQQEFLSRTQTPVVRTPEEALEAIR
jgi:hypothetical protein